MCDHYPHNYSIFFNWTLGVKAIFLSERPDNEMTYLAAMEDIPLDGVYGVTVSVSVMTSSGSVMGTASGMVQAGCGSAMLKGMNFALAQRSPQNPSNLSRLRAHVNLTRETIDSVDVYTCAKYFKTKPRIATVRYLARV